jgi:hypothetical protein
LRYEIARPGFRVRHVTLVATLLDAQVYTAEQLADAYGLRWTVEIYQPECPSSAGLYQLAA